MPSSRPPIRRRRKNAWPTVIAAVATTVPSTTPPIPSGPYSAADTAMLISSVTPASAVGVHGLWRLKNVRVSSRLKPENGRLNENQNSASAVWLVDSASNVAALVDEPRDRLGEHERDRGGRDQQQRDLARCRCACVRRSPSKSWRATSRLSVGNSTVATATVNMPWGSM